MGLPNKRHDTKSGAMVWVYIDKQKGFTAKECNVTLSIRNDTVENVVISTENKSLMSSLTDACAYLRDKVTRPN